MRRARRARQVLRFEDFAGGMAAAASRIMVDGPGRGMKSGLKLEGEEVAKGREAARCMHALCSRRMRAEHVGVARAS